MWVLLITLVSPYVSDETFLIWRGHFRPREERTRSRKSAVDPLLFKERASHLTATMETFMDLSTCCLRVWRFWVNFQCLVFLLEAIHFTVTMEIYIKKLMFPRGKEIASDSKYPTGSTFQATVFLWNPLFMVPDHTESQIQSLPMVILNI